MTEFNNYENTNQSYAYNTPGSLQNIPETSGPRKRRKDGRTARTVKKIGAITLSAVLFGSVAAGTFQAVNTLTGYAPAANTNANANAESGSSASVPNASGSPANPERSVLQTLSPSGSTAAKGSLDVSDIAASVMPSIVSITNRSVQEIQNYFSFFGRGTQSQTLETESAGSGFIIGQNAEELLIATNYHVIENAKTISACFIDNEAYEANVKGTDPGNDLAVIAIPLESISSDTMSQIKVASIGDSNALRVGEQVVAIGNALGYGQSVTTGIVSATNRTIQTEQTFTGTAADTDDAPFYIQTDAAINPGNSGGALVNMNGEVVGINSAKIGGSNIEGMGYAIPVSRVSDIIETLMNETTRTVVAAEKRGSIGISGISVDASVNQAYGIPVGAYIAEITEGGAAEAAGLQKGEVIVGFDGKSVTGIEELKERLQYYAAGETVELDLKVPGSGGYVDKTVSVTLGQAPAAKESAQPETETAVPDFNIHW